MCEVCHKPLPDEALHESYPQDIESEIWIPGTEIPTDLTDEQADELEEELRGFFAEGRKDT